MAPSLESLIHPQWPVPPQIKAVCTTRIGGVSCAPWDSLNLGVNTQDSGAKIIANRSVFVSKLPADLEIQWLKQVHGKQTFRAGISSDLRSENLPEADICYSRDKGLACAVLTADCLPILVCNSEGTEIAAVHAGWRGLVEGVLLAALENFASPPSDLMVWMGPAISLKYFEVGEEVVDAMFDAKLLDAGKLARLSRANPANNKKRYLDLPGIAKQQLADAGVNKVFGGSLCTYGEPDRFFSYRRDGETGRMATLIWIE